MKTCRALFPLFLAFRLAADAPLDLVLPVRGLCIAAPNPAQVNSLVRFIQEELAPRSVNTLILRVDFNYQYTSRPELASRSGLSLADVKRLVEVCRTHHLRLIPQINLVLYNGLGHTPEVWERPDFQKMWREMVLWTLGCRPGDATPRTQPAR